MWRTTMTTILAAIDDDLVVVTAAGGTWEQHRRLERASPPCLAVAPLDPAAVERLYVCIEAGALVRSPDGGRTWVDRTPDGPWDTHTLAAHPQRPGRLYSAAGDGFSTPGHGYQESPDGGDHWVRPDDG